MKQFSKQQTEHDSVREDGPQPEAMSNSEPTKLPDVLTVIEVAELLRCDRKTVYAAIRRTNLPHQKISARALRFSREAVLEWLRSGQSSK